MELIQYDEFSMFHENASEFGIPYGGAPAVRRDPVRLGDGRQLSALVWEMADPELVFLHGGAQNAHTWDTVALALSRPLVAIDLPGHGHSDDARDAGGDVNALAGDVAAAIRGLAPHARCVVGMSLGGIIALALLAQRFPPLVRSLVLVDVTPGVTAAKATAITDFVNGPGSFADFDELLDHTVRHNAGRSVSSLRRGILHNAFQREDGTWMWRHHRPVPATVRMADLPALWEAVSSCQVPLLLVRGTRPGSVVDDADEAELLRRNPAARVAHVDASHSVQGDQPIELARLIDEFSR